MIALALAGTIAGGNPGVRLRIDGPVGTPVMVSAQAAGGVAAFCSSSTCSLGHVRIRIPRSGSSFVILHVYGGSGATVRVTASGAHLDIARSTF